MPGDTFNLLDLGRAVGGDREAFGRIFAPGSSSSSSSSAPREDDGGPPDRPHGLQEKLVREAESISRNNPYVPFGHSFREEARRLRSAKKKPEEGVSLSITGKSSPETFTRAELHDIATDDDLARKIFKLYSGKSPSQADINNLRLRIHEAYPEIEYINPNSAQGLFKNAYEAMSRQDNPNIKPIIDFFVNNPEVTFGDNQLLEAARHVKATNYDPQSHSFQLVRDKARLYNIDRSQNIHGNRGRANVLTNIDRDLNTPWNTLNDPEDQSEFYHLAPLIQNRFREQQLSRKTDVIPRIQEAARLENLATAAERGVDRIAPLSELHEQAKGILQNNIDPESLRLAREEINAASRMNVARDVAPYLERASEDPDEYIRKYENNHQDLIEGYRREAAKNFLEHDMPKINRQFASKGAFHSGARQAALNKAIADKDERVAREIARLKVHFRSEAMKDYHQHRKHMLDVGEMAGKTSSNTQDAALRAAEALRVNALSEKDAAHRDVTALEQVARTEQEQAQNALNMRLSEYREQQERPWEELQRKSAIASANPIPHLQHSPQYNNPTPPNVYGMGAGILGQITGLNSILRERHSKGGHVRAKYADGGSIARNAAELKEMAQHTQEPTPYEQEMLSEARNIRNNNMDPMGRYLFTLGSHQIANNRQDPLKTYGEGSMRAMEAHDAARAHNLEARTRHINFLNMINQSRVDQQKFLAQYHLNKTAHDEKVRMNNAYLTETKRYHDLMHGPLAKEQAANSNVENLHLPKFPSKEAEKMFYRLEEKRLLEFDDEKKQLDKLSSSTQNKIDLFAKGIGYTGPGMSIAPKITNAFMNAFYKPATVAQRKLFFKETKKEILDLMNAAKGPQTDLDREYMEQTNILDTDPPETIRRYLEEVNKVVQRNKEATNYIETEIKKGVPIAEARRKWKEYVDEHPLFEKELKEKKQLETSNNNDLVEVIDAHGQKGMIPKANVDAFISENQGARVL